MKKKKWLIVFSALVVCILIIVFTIALINKKRTINDLMSQLENAINKHEIEKIIDLYPDYCKNEALECFSQEKLDDFYNRVIVKDSEKINIQITRIINYDTSSYDDIAEQIARDYQENIIIEDCQLVRIKYHDAFGESTLKVIKIDGNYYLYFGGYLGEPLVYFVE